MTERREAGGVRVACTVVGPIETNCYILSCADTRRALIVDPGGDPDLVRAFIENARLEPERIVSTHGHSDHIASAAELSEFDAPLLGRLFTVAGDLAREEGLESGWRLVTNVGPDAGQSVDHLHIHLLGGRPMSWPPG